MNKKLSVLLSTFVLAMCSTIALAQGTTATKTKVVANPDGSYSVIEYPVGKDVVVNLVPGASIPGKGTVHVMRTANGSHVVFDMSGVPADVTSYYAYAVDPSGAATYLGPLTFTGGVAKTEFDTPLSQFMLFQNLLRSPIRGKSRRSDWDTLFTRQRISSAMNRLLLCLPTMLSTQKGRRSGR